MIYTLSLPFFVIFLRENKTLTTLLSGFVQQESCVRLSLHLAYHAVSWLLLKFPDYGDIGKVWDRATFTKVLHMGCMVQINFSGTKSWDLDGAYIISHNLMLVQENPLLLCWSVFIGLPIDIVLSLPFSLNFSVMEVLSTMKWKSNQPKNWFQIKKLDSYHHDLFLVS